MFIFDFVAETILDQILDWIYGKIIGFCDDEQHGSGTVCITLGGSSYHFF